MNWAKDAYHTGYTFNCKSTSYESQIKHLEIYSNLGFLRPQVKQVTLPPDNLQLNVTCFNFTSMLSDLLNDKSLNKMSNLVVNQNDRFAKYESPNGRLGEVNSGYWYQHAYSTMIHDYQKDFLLPIIFAMDKTTISNSTHLHVYAVMFTTTIFDCKTRNQAHAWRPLGYIPIERIYYSSRQWKSMSSSLKSVRANILFDTVLQTFREAQKKGALIDIPLQLGNKTKTVNLKIPLAYIIGDIQGGDGICGRSAYYQADACHICRMCDATPDAYSFIDVDSCNLLVMTDIISLCNNNMLAELDALIQARNWQAF